MARKKNIHDDIIETVRLLILHYVRGGLQTKKEIYVLMKRFAEFGYTEMMMDTHFKKVTTEKAIVAIDPRVKPIHYVLNLKEEEVESFPSVATLEEKLIELLKNRPITPGPGSRKKRKLKEVTVEEMPLPLSLPIDPIKDAERKVFRSEERGQGDIGIQNNYNEFKDISIRNNTGIDLMLKFRGRSFHLVTDYNIEVKIKDEDIQITAFMPD